MGKIPTSEALGFIEDLIEEFDDLLLQYPEIKEWLKGDNELSFTFKDKETIVKANNEKI